MEHSFFDDFTSYSIAEQKAQMEKVLNMASTSVSYGWMSPEKIHIAPIYFKQPHPSKKVLTTAPIAWKIVQAIFVEGALAVIVDLINDAIAAEVDCLHFFMGDDVQGVELLFQTIKKSSVNCLFVFKTVPDKNVLDRFSAFENCSVVVDFYGQYARKGSWEKSGFEDKKRWFSMLEHTVDVPLFINASIYANAGANLVQQITFALAQLNAYLSLIHENNIGFPSTIHVQFAQGSNYFFEMAKLNAFRSLAELVVREYDTSLTLEITAEPQKRNKTTTDYNVNFLRTTTEVMSGILGGANRIMNHPYDLRFNPPNPFGDRIARNQLHLLKHESYFDKLPNVMEGSYFLEALTKQMKDKAWAQFLSLEENGGWLVALECDWIQTQIEEVRVAEQMRFTLGERLLVGTNKYVSESGLSAQVKTDKQPSINSSGSFTPIKTIYLSSEDEH